ncbi:RteC domain-containing protein [Chitinophaga defluvii]|uniref:RteC domain-containing protein n=1 Tax=Chitinophaga defluvii TaxID=3163343 RepID=A0ABV2TDH9_9BACT
MIKSSKKLVNKMTVALRAVNGEKGINSCWAQEGLKISEACIGELYELFNTEGFEDDAAEIEFFKDLSPKFLGKYIYFFALRKIAVDYAKAAGSRYDYLKEQDNYYSLFIEERKERYDALLSEELDELHFLRRKGEIEGLHEYSPVMDHRLCTPGSLLLSEIRAYSELRNDIRKEIQWLLNGRNK